MIPQRTSTASTLAVSRSIHSSSSWRNSTLSMPSWAARARATSIIGSAPSEEISVPPGRTSSAAMKPVSPGPAASSSTRWPGWSPSALHHRHRHGHPPVADAARPPVPIRRRRSPTSRGWPRAAGRGRVGRSLPEVIPRGPLGRRGELLDALAEGRVDPARSSAGRRSPPARRWPRAAARAIVSSISAQRSVGIPAASNGSHTSRMNSDTNAPETASQCSSTSLNTVSASSSETPRSTTSLGDGQQRRARDLVAALAGGDEHAQRLGPGQHGRAPARR